MQEKKYVWNFSTALEHKILFLGIWHSNWSYSTKRATDGEVCVLKGWQATAECLWCKIYPFVIRQRGKMLVRTKLGVCFYQRVAYFTAPWLSVSNTGYYNCLSPSSPSLSFKGDKWFLPSVCLNQVSKLMFQDYSQPTCRHSSAFRGPPAGPRDQELGWNTTACQLEIHTQAPPVPPVRQFVTFRSHICLEYVSRCNTTFFTDRQRN